MMKQTLERVESAIANEKTLADKDYGLLHSRHEGYGVLAEEVRELEFEFEDVMETLNDLIEFIDANEAWLHNVGIIRKHATLAAAEAIQVAAVCERILELENEECEACKIDLD